jgi:hypothetical protein
MKEMKEKEVEVGSGQVRFPKDSGGIGLIN